MLRAPVNRIIPFSAVDGPGNRTAVFLQGCNFNCQYCHNPETINPCIDCGACIEACPMHAISMRDGRMRYNRQACIECDACLKICPYCSSPRTEMLTPEETFERVKKQMPFIRGVTISGGECTLHHRFITEVFRLCKEAGLTTLADSNGTFDYLAHPELLEVMDGVMLDVKAWDPEDHFNVTGCSNEMVRKNLIALAECGKLEEVRTVVVPGLYDYRQTVVETGKALAPYLEKGQIRYKLIAYRPMGVREKYALYESPGRELLESLAEELRSLGFQDIILI